MIDPKLGFDILCILLVVLVLDSIVTHKFNLLQKLDSGRKAFIQTWNRNRNAKRPNDWPFLPLDEQGGIDPTRWN